MTDELILKLNKLLDEFFKGDYRKGAKIWMQAHNKQLGCRPIDMLENKSNELIKFVETMLEDK